jgi:threonyl-tRNA synthetase
MIDLETARHSLAHILAKAVTELYPGTLLAIGPAIADGFYYDFDSEHIFKESDFELIENKMREIINRKEDFKRIEITREQAKQLFAGKKYKLDLIDKVEEGEVFSVYYTGDDFFDLCRGPHVQNSRELMGYGFKIRSVSGAYFGGDEKGPMLQRIYVYAFESTKELNQYIAQIEEAKKRDHRVLGPQHDIFYIDDLAPGMPYWLPKGLKMINVLMDFWRKIHEQRGYQEVSTPLVNDTQLWKTSGHWKHYQENMFIIPSKERTYALKPMNCPNAMVLFKRKVRSYRDLPLRMSDCDILHRHESSGTLHGLLRVQSFRQDDSHNFITEDQIASEINEILDIADLFYGIFGLTYRPVLSTRPQDFMGDVELWSKAEKELKHILDTRYGAGNYTINQGDGAFYGPKIDILMTDALKRTWQTGTIQLDFQLPRNFELTYTAQDGSQKTPVVVHRVVYGSLERFMGILIEQFACAFPFWFSAEQVKVLPVSPAHNDYAKQIAKTLVENDIRATELIDDQTNIGNKIKQCRIDKVPYAIIVGDVEMQANTISVRVRTGKQIQNISLDSFVEACKKMNCEHTLDLIEEF